MNSSTLAMLYLSISVTAAAAEPLVPFVIPPDFNEDSPIAIAPDPPVGAKSERIVARGGHFYRGEKRVRVWGVNTCFGASFPRHADAERVARRLAAAGINSVRLHHMDMASAPRGIWDPADPWKLSPESMDKLDYFIDRLARRGITINLNLHVSRTHTRHLDLPKEGSTPNFDKIIGIFTPRLVEAQKRYARDVLTHVNKYRKVRYADDPAVAFVEITNEDSLFMWGSEAALRGLPPFYAKLLRGLFNAWLKRRYGTTGAVRKAWSVGAQPLGKNMIADAAFAMKTPGDASTPHWSLELHAGTKGSAKALAGETGAVRVAIEQVDGTDWHVQFKHRHLPIRKGQYYTLLFRARADAARRVGISCGMAHEPWQNLGMSRSVALTTRWRPFRIGFVATKGDPDGRISFVLGAKAGGVELADVRLSAGGQVGLRADESLEKGTVELFAASEVAARALDRVRFLAETEKAYFDDMRAYVIETLGCGALVTGTIVFGPAGLYGQGGMDFIDSHSYWQHPRFPGRPWDPSNWLVEQRVMTDEKRGGTLGPLAARRLAGKPYTVSEYNHPAPMDSQAECVPMIAAFAASQDWDGIWLFAYCHRTDDWDRGSFSSFFDMDTNPGKFGFFAAGAAIFRQGGLAPVGPHKTFDLRRDGEDMLTRMSRLHLRHGMSMRSVAADEFKATWQDMLTHRTYFSMGIATEELRRPGRPIAWTFDGKRGRFRAAGEAAIVETGWGGSPGPGKDRFRAVTVTALDGKPLRSSGRILVTACGRCENTGMKFSADRRTVGRNWGRAPVRIEPVDHAIVLPGRAGERVTLQPLGPDGRAGGAGVTITLDASRSVRLSPKHKTMWYLLTR